MYTVRNQKEALKVEHTEMNSFVMRQNSLRSSGYQCTSFQPSNGVMRTFSTDMMQPTTQQANLSNMNMMQHISYQTASPNAGDASNSTHNSPFAPSPSQGFDFPTSPHVKPSIPPNTDYPGDYNFCINFGEITESAPKSAQYTYSPFLNKLFVKMNVTCPIKFKCDASLPMGCTVRAVPVFKRPEHVTDIVTRCPNHKIPDEANFIQSSHLIRAEMPDEYIRYDVAHDMRESVSVRYEKPQIGAEYTTILYKFMCLSSCVGGINRRPLLVVFVLESPEGQILGRRVVDIRICSCPGRDRSQEEKRKLSDNPGTTSNGQDRAVKRPYRNLQTTMEINQTIPGKKRRSPQGNADQEEFVIKIRGREKFLILKRVKEALDLMEYVTPQQQEAYRRKEDQDQALLRQHLACDSASQNNVPASTKTAASTSSTTSAISSLLTVSEPLSNEAVATSLDMLSPTHSSHPLTATPTGVLPTSPPEMYASSTPSEHENGVSHHYWTVDGNQIGCDVPDVKSQHYMYGLQTPLNKKSSNTAHFQHDLPCTASLSREMSGASTISVSSSSSPDEPIAGRYVTRVLLRQTLSLNRDAANKNAWNEEKEAVDDFIWDRLVKTEKDPGSPLNALQAEET